MPLYHGGSSTSGLPFETSSAPRNQFNRLFINGIETG